MIVQSCSLDKPFFFFLTNYYRNVEQSWLVVFALAWHSHECLCFKLNSCTLDVKTKSTLYRCLFSPDVLHFFCFRPLHALPKVVDLEPPVLYSSITLTSSTKGFYSLCCLQEIELYRWSVICGTKESFLCLWQWQNQTSDKNVPHVPKRKYLSRDTTSSLEQESTGVFGKWCPHLKKH